MAHYLQKVYKQWSNLEAPVVDSNSVNLIEGMMPSYSTNDRSHIRSLMDDGSLFPRLTNDTKRIKVRDHFLAVKGRILSLKLFFSDASLIKRIAQPLWQFSGKNSERTLRQALLGSWEQIPGEAVTVQDTEFYFDKVSLDRIHSEVEQHAAWISYLQLWMSAFRHFIDPRRGKEGKEPGVQPLLDVQGKADLDLTAKQLGFNKRLPSSARYPVFQYISQTLTNSDSVESERVNDVRDKFVQVFLEYQDISRSRGSHPEWSTDIEERKATFRAGRPEVKEYRKIRQYFYLKIIGNDEESIKSYPTATAVMREMFFDFFGRIWLQSISSPVEMERHPSGSPSIYSVHTELAEPNPQAALGTPEFTITNETQALVPMIDVSIQSAPPKAAGFEDDENIGPFAELCYISHHRGSREIIEKWYQERDPDLVVLFLFDRRAFYKFRRNSTKELSDRIYYLAQENYFCAICNNVISIPYQETVAALLRFSLLLVGSKDGPTRTISSEGSLTLKDLERYVVCFDPKTGKRSS
jgi:Protein of unknown function (DUF3723)